MTRPDLARAWRTDLPRVVLLLLDGHRRFGDRHDPGHGAGVGAAGTANQTLLITLITPEQRPASFALGRVAQNLGLGVGATVATASVVRGDPTPEAA